MKDTSLERQLADCRHVLGLVTTLLDQARLCRMYNEGPLKEPAVDMAIRLARAELASS